ncbi:hypothetical protein EPI10_001650 [Gossypium australe]|uniref:Uncharacterized protein n=1 Tax=Gossypium australe TaxID=47621 RepID=A0A5B6VC59_9ROSI|nr:hypothetical protein EPI10_001650 [Gossypium australe]
MCTSNSERNVITWYASLFLIEIHNSYPYSGISYKKLWSSIKWRRMKLYMIMNVKLHNVELSLVRKRIHGVDLIRETEEKVKVIRDSLKVTSGPGDLMRILNEKK